MLTFLNKKAQEIQLEIFIFTSILIKLYLAYKTAEFGNHASASLRLTGTVIWYVAHGV